MGTKVLAASVLALCVAGTGSASAQTVAGEVMVKLGSTTALPGVLARHRLSLVAGFGARPIYRLALVGDADLDTTLARLALDPAVQLAEANRVQRAPEAVKNRVWAIGTAAQYSSQWAWDTAGLNLNAAHALSTGQGVTVAVLDTGVDASHPALRGRLLPGRDFVDGDLQPDEAGSASDAGYGHGTHVASIVARVAPAARILPLRVLDASGAGNAWVLAEALLHAVDPDGNPGTADGAQVINLSLGSTDATSLLGFVAQLASCAPPDPADPVQDTSDPGYNTDRQRCNVQGGAVVVAAAGNGGSPRERWYPAAESVYGQLSVAATAADGHIAAFSNSGRWIDLAAPGEAITAAVPGGWGTWSGTSMAAPMVSGTAALLRATAPSESARWVTRCMVRTGGPLAGTRVPGVDPVATLLASRDRGKGCR